MTRINLTKRPKTKGLATLKKKAWALLSRIIRLSNADYRGFCQCYTCNTQESWKEMDAGHGIGGRHNAVLYDEEIIKVQCKVCNIWKRGNYTIFTTKLIQEMGMEAWEHKLIQSRVPVKYTSGDLFVKIEEYQKRLDELENKNA